MPSFDTPAPITATVELGVGDIRITAGDRNNTVVEVTPTNPDNESDRKAAELTRVEHTDGTLRISSPRIKPFDFSGKTRSVQVSIEVPAGSQLRADTQLGSLWGTGPLGECHFKSGTGNVQLDRTGPLRVDTGAGHVTVAAAAGDAEVSTGTGRVRIDQINGTAVVKSSNGDIELGAVTGDARTRTANGTISVDQAGAGVEAKTPSGAIRIGAASSGSLNLKTGAGDIEIGIANRVAARLDVSTGYGLVRSTLDELAVQPEPSEKTVDVRAHTAFGDITVRRA